MPDALVDTKRVTKSHILVANVPTQIDVHVIQIENTTSNKYNAHLKCGKLMGSKDKNPQKRKGKYK